eukprot:TRINITY_DN11634_c0_g1_i1.p1 TRINITY_DN11634_c0_g1~~TRINITY_DN11634_c0_g1_i1.p1  ORF type:complete len:246 (-),score=55.09 TRINITY_DN11634_c0_g1_i1:26-712(-)
MTLMNSSWIILVLGVWLVSTTSLQTQSDPKPPAKVAQQFKNDFDLTYILGSISGTGWVDYEKLGGKADIHFLGINYTVIVHTFPPEQGGTCMYSLSDNMKTCSLLGKNQPFPAWIIPQNASYTGDKTIGAYQTSGWTFPPPDADPGTGDVTAYVAKLPTNPVIELLMRDVGFLGDVTIISSHVVVGPISPSIYALPKSCDHQNLVPAPIKLQQMSYVVGKAMGLKPQF